VFVVSLLSASLPDGCGLVQRANVKSYDAKERALVGKCGDDVAASIIFNHHDISVLRGQRLRDNDAVALLDACVASIAANIEKVVIARSAYQQLVKVYALVVWLILRNDGLKLAAWWNRFWEILSGDGRNGRNGALARAMSDTAMLHLFYSVYSALMEKGVSPFNKKALLEDYLAMAENLLRRRLGIGAAGRSAEWTEVELAQAIKSVLDNLKPAMRTYEQVADKLREKYGDRAPASGGALRQQVIRLGLNWKNLKRNVPFRRKPATVSYTSPEPKA
jgi:hypothetical protein